MHGFPPIIRCFHCVLIPLSVQVIKLMALSDSRGAFTNVKVDTTPFTLAGFDATDNAIGVKGQSGNVYWIGVFDATMTAKSAVHTTYKPG